MKTANPKPYENDKSTKRANTKPYEMDKPQPLRRRQNPKPYEHGKLPMNMANYKIR